jgi:hypothetical protein
MTSSGNFPNRVTKIDALSLGDHYFLEPDDSCYFVGEYTARKGYTFSQTNNLILNMKKSIATRGTPQWPYKERAIATAAAALRVAIPAGELSTSTFVPVPPSRAKSDPLYDDRIVRVLRAVQNPPMDVRELVVQIASTRAFHDTEHRLSPQELEANYQIDQHQVLPAPAKLIVVDDLLTSGCHFRAMTNILKRQFPTVGIVGLFIARRVPESDDPFPDDVSC